MASLCKLMDIVQLTQILHAQQNSSKSNVVFDANVVVLTVPIHFSELRTASYPGYG